MPFAFLIAFVLSLGLHVAALFLTDVEVLTESGDPAVDRRAEAAACRWAEASAGRARRAAKRILQNQSREEEEVEAQTGSAPLASAPRLAVPARDRRR